MKIALLAPLYYPIQAKSDGGIETFLYGLSNALVDRGHEVDLYTVAGSTTKANQIYVYKQGTDEASADPYVRQSREIAGAVKTFAMIEASPTKYDVIHNNQIAFYGHLEVSKLPNGITTLHSPPSYYPIKQAMNIDPAALGQRVVAISDFQRESSTIGFIDRVYNGIASDDYQFDPIGGGYIAWIGRLIPQKGLLDAITALRSTGLEFRFAGSTWDQAYCETVMKATEGLPMHYLGQIDLAAKNKLLGGARAFIFPSHFDELGYVRMEAMACGTPVITVDRGAARELVVDGVTGFVCPPNDPEALKAAINKMMALPDAEYQAMRQACKQRVLDLFSIDTMVDGYERVYAKIAKT